MPTAPPAIDLAGTRGKTKRAFLPVLALVSSALLACGAGETPSEEAPADSVDPLAVQADRPLVPVDGVEVSEAFRLGPAARAEANLERPLDLGYDEEGSLYVLDGRSPTRILKFDSAGRFLYRFGRHEPDVERVARATSFALAPWNTALMVDKAHNILVSYLTRGTFVSAVQIHGVAMDVLPLSDFGEFYLQKWDPSLRRAYVVRMRAPIDSLGVPYAVGIPPGQSVRKEARDIAFQTAVDRQDRLYVAFADAYPVRVVEPDGETVRLMGIDRPPAGKSEREIAAERQRNVQEIEARLPDIPDSLKAEAAEPEPAHLMIEELVIDPVGRLWVRTHRPETGRETAYDVFNAEGHFLAVVTVPGRIVRTAFEPDGTLVGIDASSEASREIVGYDVRFDRGATVVEAPGAGPDEADESTAARPPGSPGS
ncbi:MAG: hypothetical protein R3326_00080 [Gemmatimonadota bacterium]|nr:hypothetical protein [Gemmatimonadota bacterium]